MIKTIVYKTYNNSVDVISVNESVIEPITITGKVESYNVHLLEIADTIDLMLVYGSERKLIMGIPIHRILEIYYV